MRHIQFECGEYMGIFCGLLLVPLNIVMVEAKAEKNYCIFCPSVGLILA